MFPTSLILILSILVHLVTAACRGRYVYVLSFDFNWSFETDRGFPNEDPLIEPSFSQVVCASHSPSYNMWQPGAILSPSMIDFIGDKEQVKPLENELRDAQANEIIHSFNVTSEPVSSLGAITTFLSVNSSHSLISCASRINPSPAWFIGISSLDMCNGSSFRVDNDIVLLGWWGGLDEAEEYLVSKPIEQGQNPFKVRRRIDVAPFGYGTLFLTRRNPNKPIPSDLSELESPTRTSGPRIVPAAEAICVDANALSHLPREALLFSTHRHAYVFCDPFKTCATPGHIVIYQDRPMMMKSYCERHSICERRIMLVNSPKYTKGLRIDTATHDLKFTAFAARFSTRTEEGALSLAVRMGL